ncbi:hypothetical protein MXL54_00635 [Enterobacteriaceae bacterium G50]|nr:hypothetical protein [Enterobacteriaceae bacterium G50]
MTAIIAASCIFPSGPTLALADIAHRLQFSLIRKHPQWTDRCRYPIRACYFPEIASAPLTEHFRQLLREVLTELTASLPDLKQCRPAQVMLLLPPLNRPGIAPELTAIAEEAIAESTGWPHSLVYIRHGGRAEAVALLDTLAACPLPEGKFSVLLAVDSWLSPDTLAWLEDEGLLHNSHRRHNQHTQVNPYGRIPSEGAAALVLASAPTGHRPWCHIQGIGMATETVTYSDKGVCLGRGLRQAAVQALETAKITSLRHVVSDVNGEPYRADELGFALPVLNEYTDHVLTEEKPVVASGDLGCASLVTHMALAAWRMQASDQPGDTLLLSSSDDEVRGAVVLSKDEGRDK